MLNFYKNSVLLKILNPLYTLAKHYLFNKIDILYKLQFALRYLDL